MNSHKIREGSVHGFKNDPTFLSKKCPTPKQWPPSCTPRLLPSTWLDLLLVQWTKLATTTSSTTTATLLHMRRHFSSVTAHWVRCAILLPAHYWQHESKTAGEKAPGIFHASKIQKQTEAGQEEAVYLHKMNISGIEGRKKTRSRCYEYVSRKGRDMGLFLTLCQVQWNGINASKQQLKQIFEIGLRAWQGLNMWQTAMPEVYYDLWWLR